MHGNTNEQDYIPSDKTIPFIGWDIRCIHVSDDDRSAWSKQRSRQCPRKMLINKIGLQTTHT